MNYFVKKTSFQIYMYNSIHMNVIKRSVIFTIHLLPTIYHVKETLEKTEGVMQSKILSISLCVPIIK